MFGGSRFTDKCLEDCVGKEEETHIDIVIDGERVKNVDQFRYLVLRINHYNLYLKKALPVSGGEL